MSQVEKNVLNIEEREKEIVSIVQSISEINEMFRDLATLVVDQVGTTIHMEHNMLDVKRNGSANYFINPGSLGTFWHPFLTHPSQVHKKKKVM